jgi:ferredoxin
MEIVIDHDRCLGTGQCVLAAGEVFDQDEQDGHAVLLIQNPGPHLAESVREARDACPLSAITVLEG